MPNKAVDFYNINTDYFKVTNNPDYCSLCGWPKSKMRNHIVAHKLNARDLPLQARNFY